ncbi:MAG TPA: VTT domain-containing protein [Solirubrobacteraceae bacterium]|nr:VTT domain-containing protein [Solirubrobacteraceae bacterium]
MTSPADRRSAVARLAALALGIAIAFGAVTLAGVSPDEVRAWVAGAGFAGPAVFLLVGGALGLALFPGHVTATVAGMLFGAFAGTALALGATLISAVLCLLLARRVGTDAVLALLGPRGRRWRDWLTDNGFSAVLAARLAPGMPSGAVNYLAGLAGIGSRAFLAAVALGALPKTIAYVSLGGAISDPLSARGAFAVALYVAAAAGGALVARRLIRARPGAAPA